MISTVENILNSMAITGKYKGYHFIIKACTILYENRQHNILITRDVYYVIARQYGCKWYNVERDIRTVISHAWKNAPEKVNEIAGRTLNHPPTVADCLYMLLKSAFNKSANTKK